MSRVLTFYNICAHPTVGGDFGCSLFCAVWIMLQWTSPGTPFRMYTYTFLLGVNQVTGDTYVPLQPIFQSVGPLSVPRRYGSIPGAPRRYPHLALAVFFIWAPCGLHQWLSVGVCTHVFCILCVLSDKEAAQAFSYLFVEVLCILWTQTF